MSPKEYYDIIEERFRPATEDDILIIETPDHARLTLENKGKPTWDYRVRQDPASILRTQFKEGFNKSSSTHNFPPWGSTLRSTINPDNDDYTLYTSPKKLKELIEDRIQEGWEIGEDLRKVLDGEIF